MHLFSVLLLNNCDVMSYVQMYTPTHFEEVANELMNLHYSFDVCQQTMSVYTSAPE